MAAPPGLNQQYIGTAGYPVPFSTEPVPPVVHGSLVPRAATPPQQQPTLPPPPIPTQRAILPATPSGITDIDPISQVQTPAPAASSIPPPQTAPAAERPLNVTDALSYLDAVKVRFHDRSDVYNNFLDIMKDFKTSA